MGSGKKVTFNVVEAGEQIGTFNAGIKILFDDDSAPGHCPYCKETQIDFVGGPQQLRMNMLVKDTFNEDFECVVNVRKCKACGGSWILLGDGEEDRLLVYDKLNKVDIQKLLE